MRFLDLTNCIWTAPARDGRDIVFLIARFHNVLLALMLNKPVLSISYDQKNDSLMAEVGLVEYCQPIEHLDINRLVEQFITLKDNTTILKPYIKQQAKKYRGTLDEQYRLIFNNVRFSS
jgi:polysaccharide pyruvyl transferase WcaK-like protein